jgi:hypothetical protein
MSPDDPFDWSTATTVIRNQPGTAVYTNPVGQVVIRQEVDWPEEDVYVYFSVEHLPALIEALEQQLASANAAAGAVPSVKRSAGASRQKRYRQRHRNGVTAPSTVTPERDAPPVTPSTVTTDDERDGGLLLRM